MQENLIIYLIFPIVITVLCGVLRGKRSPETMQGIATLLGIGGTFVGIIYALYSVDFNNLSTSIPSLLNGIYPAFFSSLAGVFVSLTVYWFPAFWKQGDYSERTDLDTGSQILRELQLLNEHIAGKSNSSLRVQLVTMKDTIAEGQGAIKTSFDDFATKMAENNMSALKEVIEQFNTQLQEQFGGNFKQLNEAVGKLVAWQEGYRQVVEEAHTNLQQVTETLESSQKALTISSENLERIVASADSFQKSADALQKQLEGLYDVTVAFGDTATTLKEDAGKITETMQQITHKTLEDLGQNLKGISEALVIDYKELQKVIKELSMNQQR